MKSGNLNFLKPSGPLQACNGTALHLHVRFKSNRSISLSDTTWRIGTDEIACRKIGWPWKDVAQVWRGAEHKLRRYCVLFDHEFCRPQGRVTRLFGQSVSNFRVNLLDLKFSPQRGKGRHCCGKIRNVCWYLTEVSGLMGFVVTTLSTRTLVSIRVLTS